MNPDLGSDSPPGRFPVSGPCALGHNLHSLLGLRGFPGWHPGSPGGWLPRFNVLLPAAWARRTIPAEHCLLPYGKLGLWAGDARKSQYRASPQSRLQTEKVWSRYRSMVRADFIDAGV